LGIQINDFFSDSSNNEDTNDNQNNKAVKLRFNDFKNADFSNMTLSNKDFS
jgi:hypothetical protein